MTHQERHRKAWEFLTAQGIFKPGGVEDYYTDKIKEWANSSDLEDKEPPEECWGEGWDDYTRWVLLSAMELCLERMVMLQRHPEMKEWVEV